MKHLKLLHNKAERRGHFCTINALMDELFHPILGLQLAFGKNTHLTKLNKANNQAALTPEETLERPDLRLVISDMDGFREFIITTLNMAMDEAEKERIPKSKLRLVCLTFLHYETFYFE
jgi:hypothetical protein